MSIPEDDIPPADLPFLDDPNFDETSLFRDFPLNPEPFGIDDPVVSDTFRQNHRELLHAIAGGKEVLPISLTPPERKRVESLQTLPVASLISNLQDFLPPELDMCKFSEMPVADAVCSDHANVNPLHAALVQSEPRIISDQMPPKHPNRRSVPRRKKHHSLSEDIHMASASLSALDYRRGSEHSDIFSGSAQNCNAHGDIQSQQRTQNSLQAQNDMNEQIMAQKQAHAYTEVQGQERLQCSTHVGDQAHSQAQSQGMGHVQEELHPRAQPDLENGHVSRGDGYKQVKRPRKAVSFSPSTTIVMNEFPERHVKIPAGKQSGNEEAARPKKRTRTRIEDMDPSMVHECNFPGCSKKFAKKYNLKIHQRRHNGDLPFVCEYAGCAKRFMWLSSFSRHLRVHESRRNGGKTSRREKDMDGDEEADHEQEFEDSAPDVVVSGETSTVKVSDVSVVLQNELAEDVAFACALTALDSKPCENIIPMTRGSQVKRRKVTGDARAEDYYHQQVMPYNLNNPQLQKFCYHLAYHRYAEEPSIIGWNPVA